MKTIKTFIKKELSAILLLLALLGMSQGVWGYDISSKVYIYHVDNDSWGGAQLYIWKTDYNEAKTFSSVSNTNDKIRYYYFGDGWTGYSGIKFRSDDSWTKQSSGDITTNISSNSWFLGNSTAASTTLADMNGTAAFKSMVSTDGGASYSLVANSNCVATISGYTFSSGTSATATSGSTGSSNTATIYPAYGSTVSYTGTGSNGYEYMGCSTTNSSTLPSSPTTGTKNVTADKTGKEDLTTYYAYFKLKQYAATANVGSVSGGSVQIDSETSGSSSTKTVNHGNTVTFKASASSGYRFVKWNTNSSGTGDTPSTDANYEVEITSATTLYAIFAENVAPSNLYIKGPIIGTSNDCWPYNSTPFSKDGNVFTKTITASKYSCSYDTGDAAGEFILSTVYNDDTAGKLNGNVDFAKDGGDAAHWDYSTRSDATENFKYNQSFNAGDQLMITVTYLPSDNSYKMKIGPYCTPSLSGVSEANNFEPIVISSDIDVTWVVTPPGGGSGYIVSSEDTSITYKGTVGSNNTSGSDFTFTATSKANSSCISSKTVTIKTDSESCP